MKKCPFLCFFFSEKCSFQHFCWADSRLIISKICLATPIFLCGFSPCKDLLFPRGPDVAQNTVSADNVFIMHQTHYEKSDWSRAFIQFTIASKLDMINSIFAADVAFIMSSSTSAWLLSPLECSPQKQNGWTLRFCFWGWIVWKMYNKTIIEFGFRMIWWIIKTSCLRYLPRPSASADNTDTRFW